MEPIEIRAYPVSGGHGNLLDAVGPFLALLLILVCIGLAVETLKKLGDRPIWHMPLVIGSALYIASRFPSNGAGDYIMFLILSAGAVGAVYLALQWIVEKSREGRR